MSKSTQKTFRASTLHTCKLVPITDPAEIAALDRRIREAEKTLAAREAALQDPKPRKAKRGAGWQRTDVTYAQLDKLLRSLGFTCREIKLNSDARVYEHKQTGARFVFPAHPMSDGVVDYHLLGVRTSLDLYGIIDATAFDAKLRKAG